MSRRAGPFSEAVLGALLLWGWFEAGWVRLRELDVPVEGLPAELDGLRIAHLSDLHLGPPSRGAHAVERAFAWVEERRPDLVAITGDLLTRPRGEPLLRELVGGLTPPTFAVLGNHDLAISRDPLAKRTALRELAPARLLSDGGETVELRGVPVQIAGTSQATELGRGIPRRQPSSLADPAVPFRVLLCHAPFVADLLEPGAFQLVLAGHMHDGQIALPYPGGKIRFAHLNARYTNGLYRTRATTLHVSPGLGTTFVPFRFAARPEATELRLRSVR